MIGKQTAKTKLQLYCTETKQYDDEHKLMCNIKEETND